MERYEPSVRGGARRSPARAHGVRARAGQAPGRSRARRRPRPNDATRPRLRENHPSSVMSSRSTSRDERVEAKSCWGGGTPRRWAFRSGSSGTTEAQPSRSPASWPPSAKTPTSTSSFPSPRERGGSSAYAGDERVLSSGGRWRRILASASRWCATTKVTVTTRDSRSAAVTATAGSACSLDPDTT